MASSSLYAATLEPATGNISMASSSLYAAILGPATKSYLWPHHPFMLLH